MKLRDGTKENKYIEASVLMMIATLVAKFLSRLSAYLIHTATVRPPIPYQQTVSLEDRENASASQTNAPDECVEAMQNAVLHNRRSVTRERSNQRYWNGAAGQLYIAHPN